MAWRRSKGARADQKFEQAGLPVPADRNFVRVPWARRRCRVREPRHALGQGPAQRQLTNGAARRAAAGDRRPDVLVGEPLILETYCPDELAGVPATSSTSTRSTTRSRTSRSRAEGRDARLRGTSRASWAAPRTTSPSWSPSSRWQTRSSTRRRSREGAQWVVDASPRPGGGGRDVPDADGSMAVHGHAPGREGAPPCCCTPTTTCSRR